MKCVPECVDVVRAKLLECQVAVEVSLGGAPTVSRTASSRSSRSHSSTSPSRLRGTRTRCTPGSSGAGISVASSVRSRTPPPRGIRQADSRIRRVRGGPGRRAHCTSRPCTRPTTRRRRHLGSRTGFELAEARWHRLERPASHAWYRSGRIRHTRYRPAAELPPIPAVSVKGMLQADVAAGPDVRAAVPASRILHLEVEIRFVRAVVEDHAIVGVYTTRRGAPRSSRWNRTTPPTG